MSNINIAALKARLNQLSNKNSVSQVLWKPQEGSNLIRIVPLHTNPEDPFIEAYFHYIGGKTYLSPMTFGDPDPIEEFAQHLRAGGGLSKEEWNETRKFIPKLRTFAPVIVRGKEDEGVRYWGFGKKTYEELLGFIADEDYGDIVDPKLGRDIRVEFVPGEKSNTKFPQTKIRVSTKQTPITTDAALLEKILTVQPVLLDFYDRPSYDDLKAVLDKMVSPEAEVTRSTTPAEEWGEEEPEATPPAASPTAQKSAEKSSTVKKKITDDFDAIFNDA